MTVTRATGARYGLPWLTLVAGLWLCPVGVLSQEAPPAPIAPDSASSLPDSVTAARMSPGTAFLRATLLPGWGHASIGSYSRGGFYFMLETATAYGLLRTRKRISEANERVLFREAIVRLDLAAEGVTDAAEIEDRLDADEELEDLRALQEARGQQQEDWVALGIFLLFLSGADAYVSAHLADFPVPLEFQASPLGDGVVEVGFRIKLPN